MFDLIDMLIVRPIVNIFFAIYSLVGDFGIAIIIFVIIVKIFMWPMMKRQLHQTRIMKQIQPELAEIKKRCKGNRQLESLQMMDLYKRKNVKPFRSMLTILIQLPLFISLFTAINVVARPRENYNVDHSAYSFVKQIPRVNDLIGTQNKYLEEVKTYNEKKDEEKGDAPVYEFQPKLFNLIDLSVTAGFTSKSSVAILIFALLSAATQFIMSRQQDPSRQKGKKKRGFREIMKDAAAGKEADQSEINAVAQGQMTWMMPLMMLMIMMNLPGALVLYYLLNNIITVALQKIILNRDYTEMEAAADKRILKELKDAQEAVIVEDNTKTTETKKTTHYASNNKNKNEKAHITRISASNKKKRR